MGIGNNMHIVINHSNPNGQYLITIILEIVFAIINIMTPKSLHTITFRWNQSHGHDGIGGLLRPITLVFWSFASMFLLCEYGQMVTTRFEDIDEAIYQCEWHSFPDKVQRILPTIINNTQQLVIISGFCDVQYTRETFDSVSWKLTNHWTSIFFFFND